MVLQHMTCAAGSACGAAAYDLRVTKQGCRSTGSWQHALPVGLEPTSADTHREGANSRCEEQQTLLERQHCAGHVPDVLRAPWLHCKQTHSNDRLCTLGGAVLLQLAPQSEGCLQLAALAAGDQQGGAHLVRQGQPSRCHAVLDLHQHRAAERRAQLQACEL